jgi:hypothetical protein
MALETESRPLLKPGTSHAQRASWKGDRRERLVALAVGQVRSVLRKYPDALPDIVAAAAAATVERDGS